MMSAHTLHELRLNLLH